MKKVICFLMTILLLGLLLAGCGSPKKDKNAKEEEKETVSESGEGEIEEAVDETEESEAEGEKVIHGIINRIGDYLVLLTEDGEYQAMDFGEGITADGFEEGDSVDVTYTGELGQEDTQPVITAMTKAE